MSKTLVETGFPGQEIAFAESKIDVYTAPNGGMIDVSPYLKHPEDFHGDPCVDQVVCFGGGFEGLIGRFQGGGEWREQAQVENGIVVLEDHVLEARQLMDGVNDLAQRAIRDQGLYDDKGFCTDYLELARRGYDLLQEYQEQAGLANDSYLPISLERAGLVSTRLALGVPLDERLPAEFRVVTKRTHLRNEPDTHLSVTVKWREPGRFAELDGEELLLSDFVNPASGASGAAFVMGLESHGITPAAVHHRSISATKQGTLFIREAFKRLGIETTFYSVGIADELNDMYYLVGERAVGDAGHMLRHFLPSWYRP